VAEGWRNLWAYIRRLPWYRFAAGVLAGGAGLLVTFFMRAFGLGVFLPEIAVDFVVGRIPGETSALALVFSVVELASRGWRGVIMTPKAAAEIERLRRAIATGQPLDNVQTTEEVVAA